MKATGHIDDPTWAALADAHPEKQLLELIFFMGTYTMLAWLFNAVGLDPEERQRHYAEDLFRAD